MNREEVFDMQSLGLRAAFAVLAVGVLAAPAGFAADKVLSGEQVRALISGNTVIGALGARMFDFTYTPDGDVYGTLNASTGSGSWRILDGDRYCHEWSVFFDGTETCYQWHDLGDGRYRMVNVDAFRTWDLQVWRIHKGPD
jgi:hypothetical protein